jgi:hypothetical protein
MWRQGGRSADLSSSWPGRRMAMLREAGRRGRGSCLHGMLGGRLADGGGCGTRKLDGSESGKGRLRRTSLGCDWSCALPTLPFPAPLHLPAPRPHSLAATHVPPPRTCSPALVHPNRFSASAPWLAAVAQRRRRGSWRANARRDPVGVTWVTTGSRRDWVTA